MEPHLYPIARGPSGPIIKTLLGLSPRILQEYSSLYARNDLRSLRFMSSSTERIGPLCDANVEKAFDKHVKPGWDLHQDYPEYHDVFDLMFCDDGTLSHLESFPCNTKKPRRYAL